MPVASFSRRLLSAFMTLPQDAVHPTYEVTWVSSGTIAVAVDGLGSVTLAPGRVLLIPPGVLHSSACMEDTTESVVLHLRPPVGLPDAPSLRLASAAVREAMAAFPDVATRPAELGPAAKKLIAALVTSPATEGVQDPRLARVLHAISEDPARPHRQTELARIAGMSPSQFSRAFTASLGEPPSRYVRTHRVRLAARLLRTTERTATDIASATGFRSPARLTEAFRAVMGVSPSEYRREAPAVPHCAVS